MINTLRELAVEDAGQRPEQADMARRVICDFASSWFSKDECKDVKGTKLKLVDVRTRVVPVSGAPDGVLMRSATWMPETDEEAKTECRHQVEVRETGLRKTAAGAGACREDR